MENPAFRKGLDAITSSLNHIGDTFEKAFEVKCVRSFLGNGILFLGLPCLVNCKHFLLLVFYLQI